jgi:hypothetical protein
VIHGARLLNLSFSSFIFISLRMEGALLTLESNAIWHRKPKMSCRIDRVVGAESFMALFLSGEIS